jgi:hypothetical protein
LDHACAAGELIALRLFFNATTKPILPREWRNGTPAGLRQVRFVPSDLRRRFSAPGDKRGEVVEAGEPEYFTEPDLVAWIEDRFTPLVGDEWPVAVDASEPGPILSGVRTNRAADAEAACGAWIKKLKEQPANKDTAFEDAKAAVAHIGHLSRKAFDRAWANNARPGWKQGGRRKKE